jgi:transcription antitermination factor NusG
MKPIDLSIPHWFCVHTKPSHEAAVVQSLRRMTDQVRQNVGEIDVYFPQMKVKMPVGGHLRLVTRPLFPRYLFARFILGKAGRFVASRNQVLGLVQFGAQPSIVPQEVIEELRSWSQDVDPEIFDPTSELKAGQRVLIQGGPFKGMEAELVCHLSDQKRVALLLDHLQSRARLIVDRTYLKAIP